MASLNESLGIDQVDRRHSGHAGSTVDQPQSIPQFHFQRLNILFCENFGRFPPYPLLVHMSSPIRFRPKCESCTKSPLAPTLPCSKISGTMPWFRNDTGFFDHRRTLRRNSPVKRVQASKHHATRIYFIKRLPYPARMAADQVILQIVELVGFNTVLRHRAKAGVDPIYDFVFGEVR